VIAEATFDTTAKAIAVAPFGIELYEYRAA
jgi:hypothetical protein